MTETVSKGKVVALEYTLKLEDNQVVDTNVGKNPLTYTQGADQIIPGVESAVEGMTVFAPSSAQEVGVMLETALQLSGPASVRCPGRSYRRPSSWENIRSGWAGSLPRWSTSCRCRRPNGRNIRGRSRRRSSP